MSRSSRSTVSKRQLPPHPSTDHSGHESPKKVKVQGGSTPSTPEHRGAPNTPKSDFHKYAESILSPIGLQSPGASYTPNLLTAPSSRDWSPYVRQSQHTSARPSDLDYFGFGDMPSSTSSAQTQKFKSNSVPSPQFEGLFDSAAMDMYSHSRTSSSDAPSTAQLLLSPGFVFDDMIGATTPTMTEIARLHRVGTNESEGTSERKGLNLFGSSIETVQDRKHIRKRSQKKKPSENDEQGDEYEETESEERTDRNPTSPGLAAITAAAKKIEKHNGIKSRNRKVAADTSNDVDSDMEERPARVKGRPPIPPATRHAHSPCAPPVESNIESPGMGSRKDSYVGYGTTPSSGSSNGRGTYAAIAPRSGSSSVSGDVRRGDAVGREEHATPESAGSMAHPNMSPDPKSLAPCNCKKSRCLKLYCDCFRAQRYCNGCHCKSCANLESHESERVAARNAITERNPEAFKPRIAITEVVLSSAPQAVSATGSTPPGATVFGQHQSGCHCKKSACLKKYCECFQAGVPCLDRCRCLDCKNTAENVASGFSNISKSGGSVFVGVSGSTPASGSYSADVLKRQMLGQGGGGKSLLASCFPDVDNIPDDKPIYNKAQAEQAAFEIVSAFLRGEISVPGLESLSGGHISLSRVPSVPSEQNGHGRPQMLMSLAEAGKDSSDLQTGEKLLSGGKQLSANSSLVQMVAHAPHGQDVSTSESKPDRGSTSA